MQLVTVSKKNQNKYVRRYHKLADGSAKIDHERAGLAAEIRGEFPKGASGDLQFKEWTVTHLGIHGRSALALLDSVRALTLFPTEAEWIAVGGWKGISFLASLKRGARRKVFKAANAKAIKLGRGIVYETVLTTAYGLGVRSERREGRPNRSETEVKLGILRDFVLKLYEDYEVGALPKLGKKQEDALGRGVLASIVRALA